MGNAARAHAPLSGSAVVAGPGSSFSPFFPNPTSWWGGSGQWGPPFPGFAQGYSVPWCNPPYQYPNMGPSQQWAPGGSQGDGPSTHSQPLVLATPTSSAPSTEPDEDSVNPFLSKGEREGLQGSEEESEDEDTAVPGKRKYLPRDSTVKFLNSVTENTLRNDHRRELLEKFPISSCDPAHPPKVHAALMGIIPKPAKRLDRLLSKMQQFEMDALGPLTWLYEQLETTETVDRTRAKLAVQSALSLLGNATAHFSLERHKAIMKHLTSLDGDPTFLVRILVRRQRQLPTICEP